MQLPPRFFNGAGDNDPLQTGLVEWVGSVIVTYSLEKALCGHATLVSTASAEPTSDMVGRTCSIRNSGDQDFICDAVARAVLAWKTGPDYGSFQ